VETRQVIEADLQFVKEVTRLGGQSLKKCFQCGTCSVVCSLSPEEAPFPRKEMIWAQWGLKDRLLKDPDVWLCHHCTDCSTNCPRSANPGDVLAALRRYTIMHFAFPRFLAKAFSSPKYLPLVLALPALLLFAFLAILGDLSYPEGEIATARFIPMSHGYIGMTALTIVVLIITLVGLVRFWRSISQSLAPGSVDNKGLITGVVSALVDILWHRNFWKCETNKLGFLVHAGIFYGLVGVLIATSLAALFHIAGIMEAPYSQTNVVKIFGNVGGALVIAALIVAIFKRLFQSSTESKSTYFDWFLIVILLLVIITGFATEYLRLGELATGTYSIYLVHLWLMFTLFLYGPYYKGAHFIYRVLAMVHAKQIGRGVS